MLRPHLRVLLPAVLAAATLAGCSSTKAEGYVNPNFDLKKIQRIAVVDGNNPTFSMAVRQQMVDAFQFDMLKKGWNVIDRNNIQNAIDEMKFQNSDFTSQADRQKLGSVLNVEALTVINIASAGEDLALTAKMLDVQTGEIIWIGNGEGNVNSTMSMLTGAIIGTAVGAAIGHNAGDNASTGAIAGAVVGGVGGRAMSDTQIENAKLMVAKICDTLPPR